MMFLFLQLAVWLLIAGLLGFAAGWFLQARRAGKKLAEHRERYRQHIQRLELGLAEVAEQEPYAKERREPIEVSENPESFLSGAEEAEANRREMLDEGASATRAESSGLQSGQRVTLTSLQDETAAISEPEVEVDGDVVEPFAAESVNSLVDEPDVGGVVAPAEWGDRLQSCEREITVLRQRLGRLEQRCDTPAVGVKPLDKAVAAMSAVSQGAAENTSGVKPYGMAAPDGEPDDLKRIWGVGPKLEGMLNDMGIFHFRQIAAFSEADVENVSAELDQFSDRVKRDDWITQAKKLMAEAK